VKKEQKQGITIGKGGKKGKSYLTLSQFYRLTPEPKGVLFYGDQFQLERMRRELEGRFSGGLLGSGREMDEAENGMGGKNKGKKIEQNSNGNSKIPIEKFYFDEVDWEEIGKSLKTLSLFDTQRVIFIFHSKCPSQISKWLEWLEGGNRFYLFCFTEKGIPKFPISVRLFSPTDGELRQIVYREIKRLGIDLSSDGVEWLLQTVSPPRLFSELEKLTLLEQPIPTEILPQLIFPSKESGLQEIWWNFLIGNLSISKIISLTTLYSVDLLLGSFIYQVKELFKVYLFIAQTGIGNLQKLYGYRLPPKVEEFKKRVALSLTPTDYRQILGILLKTQLESRLKPDPVHSHFWKGIFQIANYLAKKKVKKGGK